MYISGLSVTCVIGIVGADHRQELTHMKADYVENLESMLLIKKYQTMKQINPVYLRHQKFI